MKSWNNFCILSTKSQPAIRRRWGDTKLQRFPPWLPEPWGPGKSYLGIRMILILPQDVANMFVHMFSSKLEQLKAIIIRSIKRSWQNRWRRRAQIHKQGSEAISCVGVLLQDSRSWVLLELGLCKSRSFSVRFRQWKRYFYWRWNRPQSESS